MLALSWVITLEMVLHHVFKRLKVDLVCCFLLAPPWQSACAAYPEAVRVMNDEHANVGFPQASGNIFLVPLLLLLVHVIPRR